MLNSMKLRFNIDKTTYLETEIPVVGSPRQVRFSLVQPVLHHRWCQQRFLQWVTWSQSSIKQPSTHRSVARSRPTVRPFDCQLSRCCPAVGEAQIDQLSVVSGTGQTSSVALSSSPRRHWYTKLQTSRNNTHNLWRNHQFLGNIFLF